MRENIPYTDEEIKQLCENTLYDFDSVYVEGCEMDIVNVVDKYFTDDLEALNETIYLFDMIKKDYYWCVDAFMTTCYKNPIGFFMANYVPYTERKDNKLTILDRKRKIELMFVGVMK